MNELTTTTQQPTATLEVLTLEVKFYLNQTAQNIIEVGKRLNQAKELVPHGEWGNWLESNFKLSKMSASRFMRVADRFGKSNDVVTFQAYQMIELLALPAEKTEQFIEAKAAEGKPVEDMTIRQMREEIQQWKSRAEVNENALKESQLDLQDASRKVGKIAQDFNNLQAEKKLLERRLDDAQKRLTERYEQETREQKLAEGQEIGKLVLLAEARLGELFSQLPKTSGGDRRSDNFKIRPATKFENDETPTKLETARDMGFSKDQVSQFQRLADNPDAVQKAIATA